MFGIELRRLGYAVTRSDGSVNEYAMKGVIRAIDSLFNSGERQIIAGSGMYVVSVERTDRRGRMADMEGYEFKAEIFEPNGVRNVELIAMPQAESDIFSARVIEI